MTIFQTHCAVYITSLKTKNKLFLNLPDIIPEDVFTFP